MDRRWARKQSRRMAKPGKLRRYLREWRGDMTLETAAFKVAELAVERGLDLSSKKIPTSHAAISRLESGKSGYDELTLEILAEVYGCHPLALLSRRPDEPPTIFEQQLTMDERSRVEGFIQGMRSGAR